MADFTNLENANELVLGTLSDVNKEVKDSLEKSYTGQYKQVKKQKRREQFKKVLDKNANNACLNFKHQTNAYGIVPTNRDEYSLNIDSWGWSAVLTAVLAAGKPLRFTMHRLFSNYGFFQNNLADEKQFYQFVDIIENRYQRHKNPYHNSTHAADVLQTTHHMINATGLYHWLSDLELMAMLFAAAIHDAEHTGTTNDFHINTKSPLAVLYKDQSVLENHHLAVAWETLAQADIFEPLEQSELKYMKELVTEMVLATDMARHFPQLNEIKNTIDNTPKALWHKVMEDQAEYPSQLEKPKLMSLTIHAADISNAFKKWHIHHYTTMQLLQEFFEQGDMCKRRGMPLPPLCDRQFTDIPMSQINFSKYLVKPTFDLLSKSMRLLAEVFLPKTQDIIRRESNAAPVSSNESKKNESNFGRASLMQAPGGQTLDLLGFQTVFKKNSIRPSTRNVSCQLVLERLDEFDEMWSSCMNENQQRWELFQADAAVTEELRKNAMADCGSRLASSQIRARPNNPVEAKRSPNPNTAADARKASLQEYGNKDRTLEALKQTQQKRNSKEIFPDVEMDREPSVIKTSKTSADSAPSETKSSARACDNEST